MKVASDQPTFLPWGGFWHKALSVDKMVYSIAVPVSYGAKDHYHNRVRLNGSWLTLPIQGRTDGVPWKDVEFDRAGLALIAKTLRNSFGKRYPHQARVLELAAMVEAWDGPPRLADLNIAMIDKMAALMGRTVVAVNDYSPPDQSFSKTERLIARLRRASPDEPIDYYMGRGALAYMDVKKMAEADIRVFLQVLAPELRDETAVQVIAREDDPAEALCALGRWEPRA